MGELGKLEESESSIKKGKWEPIKTFSIFPIMPTTGDPHIRIGMDFIPGAALNLSLSEAGILADSMQREISEARVREMLGPQVRRVCRWQHFLQWRGWVNITDPLNAEADAQEVFRHKNYGGSFHHGCVHLHRLAFFKSEDEAEEGQELFTLDEIGGLKKQYSYTGALNQLRPSEGEDKPEDCNCQVFISDAESATGENLIEIQFCARHESGWQDHEAVADFKDIFIPAHLLETGTDAEVREVMKGVIEWKRKHSL